MLSSDTQTRARPVVLLVDDNENNLKVLFRTLTGLDCRLLIAKSGHDALEVAKRNTPALVLLDVLMPGIDGFETCRLLKENPATRDAAVIFLSALGETTEKLKGFEAGGVDYVSKPFQPEEVLARVRTQLALRMLQLDMQRRNAELQQLNEQKNHLLGMAAHDLRNPLTVVTGYARLLECGRLGTLTEQQQEVITAMQRAGQRMLDLVNDLLDVSRLNAGTLDLRLSDVEPRLFFDESVKLMGYHARAKDIDLTASIDEELPGPLQIDVGKMRQVVENLLSNAIKFSARNTAIRAELSASADRSSIVLRVRDQGPGVPEHDLAHLFEPFRKGSARSTEGERSTGLGLAIVKRIVEGHRGRIEVRSRLGEGTIISVAIPLAGNAVTADLWHGEAAFAAAI